METLKPKKQSEFSSRSKKNCFREQKIKTLTPKSMAYIIKNSVIVDNFVLTNQNF
jgi:hypothetical protein